ncbi:major histocompatibility complex class I-related gene protein-like [Mobula birostris]|uniref:major histocompatibility complex class I-related gene protein-like n=1 Tax=Mobula birostris TaxID=1983395 RepID=UPI003B28A4D2
MESWNGPGLLLFTILSLCSVAGSQTVSHSLTYFYLHSINIPELPYISMVGMLDDLQICYYDSTIQRVEAKQQWIMDGFSANDWKNQKEIPDAIKKLLPPNLTPFASMLGIRYIQGLLGCTQSANTFKTFLKIGCQDLGELICDFTTGKCITTGVLMLVNDYLQQVNIADIPEIYVMNSTCIQYLQKGLQLGREELERQVAPEVQVLKKRPTATEGESLSCIITPFYPRAINATWLKNGLVVSKGYEVTVLPNYNATYWMELVIELQDNDMNIYTCHVKHSSLPGALMVQGGAGEPRGAGPLLGLMATLTMMIKVV